MPDPILCYHCHQLTTNGIEGHAPDCPVPELIALAVAAPPRLALFAWIGEDEYGGGEIGLKQGRVPAGMVPLVALRRDKIDRPEIRTALQAQARTYGKTIRLARFEVAADDLVVLHGHDA